jgi:hypothetical protein
LIDAGYLPEEALRELQARAAAGGATLLDQAWIVLRSTAATPDPHPDDTLG